MCTMPKLMFSCIVASIYRYGAHLSCQMHSGTRFVISVMRLTDRQMVVRHVRPKALRSVSQLTRDRHVM